MRILSRSTIRAFWERHPDAEQALRDWYQVAEKADWSSPDQVKQRYPDASIITDNRLVTRMSYPYRRVYIRFVGTHAEYDRINVAEV